MKLKDLLKEHRIRETRPRKEVLEAAFSLGKRHFSAEDLLKCLRRKKKKVSRASVFRAINLFSDKKLLFVADLGHGFKIYESASQKNHHDHLYCVKCGAIIEFEDKNIEKLQDKACRSKKFSPLSHTLRIVGLCKECKG